MIHWEYVTGGHGDRCAHRTWRNNELGVQCELITRRRANGEWLEGELFYFIDNDPREFRDEADMMKALDEVKDCSKYRVIKVYESDQARR